MNQSADRKRTNAVISVYFSIVIGLLLALLCTTIEAARTAAANAYISRVLQTAMESSLSDYYLPLFERYHLFGLHIEGENEEERKEALIADTSEGIKDNFSPQSSTSVISMLSDESGKNFLICNPVLQKSEVIQTKYLTDEQGQELICQAAAYMKYNAPVSLVESLLEAKGMLEDTEKSAQVTQKKLKVEETCTKIDQKILRLITLIDGVKTDEDGIWESSFLGNLDCMDSFVKQFVNFEVSQSSVQINHIKIYELMEDEYEHSQESIQNLLMLGQTAFAEYERLRMEEEELQIPPEDSQLLYLEQDTSVSYTSNCMMEGIRLQAEHIAEDTAEALAIIDEIEALRAQAREQLTTFNIELESIKDQLPDGLYEELTTSSPCMEQYANTDIPGIGMILDIHQMRETLLQNQNVLLCLLSLERNSFTFESEGFYRWESTLSGWSSILNGYSHRGLVFDYSKISFEKQSNNITSTIRNFIASGMASLVLEDTAKISDASLSGTELPSESIGISTSGTLSRLISLMTTIGEDTSELLNADDETDTDTTQSKIDWDDKLLFLAYIFSHTTNYCSESYDLGQVLNYEQEYLLYGNLADSDNLNCCVLRLIELRTVVNFIYLLTDQEKVMQAQAFAMSTVGMTGLAFLVSAVKYIVLFAWAVVQSIVETSALLMGKKVAVATTRINFVVAFSELLTVSNSYITSKAKAYEANGFTANYDHYLLLLLSLRGSTSNALRMMDLIQENLRYEYEDEFRIRNCLIGYEESIVCTMPQKFLLLPVFQEYKTKIDGYEFQKTNYVSY